MVEPPEELQNRHPRKAGQQPTARVTIDAYNRLKAELADLIENGRPYISERIKIAREHGDIRENSEYDAAKNEQGLMESKIRKLQQMLRDPDIVQVPTETDAVGPGMLVTVRPLDDDDHEEETYLLAEHAEEKASGARTVTITSPFGSALMGVAEGEEIVYQAPGGSFRYVVVGFVPHTG